MTRNKYNLESLDRHGVSPADADEVIATGIWEEMLLSKHGNTRLMFVGFTANGRLLEVAVEYFDDEDMEYIFHANDATRYYRALFRKRTVGR